MASFPVIANNAKNTVLSINVYIQDLTDNDAEYWMILQIHFVQRITLIISLPAQDIPNLIDLLKLYIGK